jgi:hypothetical protein
MRLATKGMEAALVSVAILVASSGGCSVPDVTFFADDGSSDASADDVLGGDVTALDVAGDAMDAGGDASDAGDAATGCNPAALPAGASMCCGPIACNGCSTQADCTACEMKQCPISQICCLRAQGASCKMTGMACQ